MEINGEEHVLPSGNGAETPTPDDFVKLLPTLYYAVNRVLEDCIPAFSKKVAVVLLAFENTTTVDETGKYLATADIATMFLEKFVASEKSVKSETSKVKGDLLHLKFVKIEGDRDHTYLTPRGEQAVAKVLEAAAPIVRETLASLSPEEQRTLWNYIQRMIATIKKPAATELPSRKSKDADVA
jgi:hypothetical protein